MNILTIKHQEFFPDDVELDTDTFSKREAARAVVIGKNGKIALLKVGRHNYHKLPGGGIENDESKNEALSREIFEEIGCTAKINGELGIVIEFRDQWKLKQTSYCYVAKQYGLIKEPEFTPEETADDFSVIWVNDIETAIATLKSDSPSNYDGLFIQKRDLYLLRQAEQLDLLQV